MQPRHPYLGLAVIGAAVFANGAAGGFTVDLVISSVAFWIFTFARSRNGKGPAPIPFVAGNLLVGLSFALPLYLYFSERARVPA